MQSAKNGFAVFFGVAALLFALRMLAAFVQAPVALAFVLSVLLAVLFVALPIYAIYCASRESWSVWLAVGFVLIGAALHGGGLLLVGYALGPSGWGAIALGLGQVGLMIWTMGLGALVALLIRDRNLLLPILPFIAALDIFLIFAPISFTRRMLEERPEYAQAISMSVPAPVADASQLGTIQTLAIVGAADLVMLAMFFVLLFKLDMRPKLTLIWIAPVLAAYLLIVLLFGDVSVGQISFGMLPALVPIAATVLLVNRDQFSPSREERAATWVVTIVSAVIAIYAIVAGAAAEPAPTGLESQAGSSRSEPAQAPPE